ncbi:50S ribosomal protein L25/general stress protein Ctc [Pseudemcibacter aquimaris]|uniref:50S ribosomal protein L25/general stress protein Ctc n=1 Tax=Pseudemcibacter aquimaris TaxID=2857064 RepID=UPI00201250E6|nr:50S ribosomal protein L25/general stress protein Ctc [Pseudemcibacter aquimaris]MCC3861001.1 50S ribosomal protein L25/general stress protein Ctc [Pseudemcibacter aquimaris]WDU59819.1 50S ribosomal protein L25/general stress protein Ctc [Pseudemcibacter aquimaris]
MANTVIKAEVRTKAGKGSSRAMRREGRLPAVIYGDKKDAVSISVDRVEIVKQMNTGSFLSTTYDVEVEGKKEMVIPRDVQLHPISDWPMHIDFLRLSKNATININIPVHVINEDDCPGIRQGGIVNIVRHEVEFECPANAIPESIEIDLTGAELGDSIHISSVKLPEGVTPTIDDRDFTVATISAPSGLKSAESEEAESDEEHSVEVEATSQKSEDAE